MKKVTVIGGGIAGLSSAALLAQKGYQVVLLEKNSQLGGRCRQFTTDNGFVFDMGPSWYWMPEVFENYYQQFGHTASDFYQLDRLSPSYRIYWEDGSYDDVPAKLSDLIAWFESLEKGSGEKLEKFLADAAYKYKVGMTDLVYKPGKSILEFMDWRVLSGLMKMHLLSSFSGYIRKYFSHPKLLKTLEFPVLFLGATPEETPALYSLMNYADLQLGTWYPQGGMYKIVEAFEKIAREQGVEIRVNEEVTGFEYKDRQISKVLTKNGSYDTDVFVSGADYNHTELLLKENANYSKKYWDKRTMAPSSLLFYLGTDIKIPNLKHHNLFFDKPFSQHAFEIYKDPQWPSDPLFYVCVPSISDQTVAPEGAENLFVLVPIAPDLKDSEEIREQYFEQLMDRLEQHTKTEIRSHIVYKRSYAVDDFKKDYHAFKGNAYGLANTLKQTAILKPKLKNKHLKNCYYTGQLTVPGPGLPPAIVSGEVVAAEIAKDFKL